MVERHVFIINIFSSSKFNFTNKVLYGKRDIRDAIACKFIKYLKCYTDHSQNFSTA